MGCVWRMINKWDNAAVTVEQVKARQEETHTLMIKIALHDGVDPTTTRPSAFAPQGK